MIDFILILFIGVCLFLPALVIILMLLIKEGGRKMKKLFVSMMIVLVLPVVAFSMEFRGGKIQNTVRHSEYCFKDKEVKNIIMHHVTDHRPEMKEVDKKNKWKHMGTVFTVYTDTIYTDIDTGDHVKREKVNGLCLDVVETLERR